MRLAITLAAIGITLGLSMTAHQPVMANPISEFVTVDGLNFRIAGAPHHFSGANCYYLMTWAADSTLQTS